MSGECDECNEHALDCECIHIIPWERKWISKEDANKIYNFQSKENIDAME